MSRYRTYTPRDEPPLTDGDEQFIGVNMRLEPDKVQPGFLAYGTQNLRFRKGEAETRLGLIKPAWLNFNAAGVRFGQLYGCGVFKDPASVEWSILAADGMILRAKPGNRPQTLILPSGVRILDRCSFVQAFGQLFCFRGRYLAPLVLNDVDDGWQDLLPQWNKTATYHAAVTALSTLPDEVAYGPFLTLATIDAVNKTVQVVTSVAHGYVTGADVTIQTASSALNGRWNITVKDEFTFQYTYAGGQPVHLTAGTCSNMAWYYQALGSRVVPSALTNATDLVTVTAAAHGFTTGQYVTIAGVSPADYNGTYQITVTTANQFTYPIVTSPASATAMGTATTSIVLAGQSPDTNPEAWQRIFNVLPNADDGVYVNNRLFVATAYTPDATGYDSTAVGYTKKDYLVATDSLDYIHFDFVNNEFRINEGSDDEIMSVVVYNMTTLLIFKGKSWGILTGIGLDLTGVSLNMFGATYGTCALRGAVTAGEDVLFPSNKRGICSCYMTQLGQIRGTDTPFSNEMELVIQRINWNFGAGIRTAWWNDCLYCAVPLDDGVVKVEQPWVPIARPTQERDGAPATDAAVYYTGLTPGQKYWFDPGPAGDPGAPDYLVSGSASKSAPITAGYFTPQYSTAYAFYPLGSQYAGRLYALPAGNNALLVYDYRMGYSGSPLTYDFRGGQWAGLDTGPFCVLEFFKATVNGVERLFFIGADGYVSMLEESTAGDQVYDGNGPNNLAFAPIQSIAVTRGYRTTGQKSADDDEGQRRWQRLNLIVSTLNPQLSITANTGAAYSTLPLVNALTFDRTSYFKPFDAPAWDPTNTNADFQTPGRFDYSVVLASGGTKLTGGLSLSTFQELTKRVSLRPLTGRFAQFVITNSQGRMRLKAPRPEAIEAERRNGILI